jgi:hypothetical protein
MKTITKILRVEPYTVTCLFDNGEIRDIDFTEQIKQYKENNLWLSVLSDKEVFNKVILDSYGTLSWNNEIEFCPDMLYKQSKICQMA